ncbi:MAG: sulfurtransferase TusA family protein [Alphaproteobacteria bacterium]
MSNHTYDARGLICPLPVLKARKILLSLPAGAALTVSVTDSHAPKDFELFCAEAGYALKGITPNDGGFDITIVKAAA